MVRSIERLWLKMGKVRLHNLFAIFSRTRIAAASIGLWWSFKTELPPKLLVYSLLRWQTLYPNDH